VNGHSATATPTYGVPAEMLITCLEQQAQARRAAVPGWPCGGNHHLQGLPGIAHHGRRQPAGVSALPELVVSAEVSDDGAVRLEWAFRETDGHCGPSTASVDIWLDSLDDVRKVAAEIRALLPA